MTKKPKEISDMKPTCGGCRFWDEVTEVGDEERYGNCRRYPPTMLQFDESPYPVWPLTAAAEWCGELVSVN